MKRALNILGGLMIVMGVIWILQGTNIVAGGAADFRELHDGQAGLIGNGAWARHVSGAILLVWNNRTIKPKCRAGRYRPSNRFDSTLTPRSYIRLPRRNPDRDRVVGTDHQLQLGHAAGMIHCSAARIIAGAIAAP